MRGARPRAELVVVLAVTGGCTLDPSAFGVTLPGVDAGTPPPFEEACTVAVSVDLDADGLVELERAVTFAADGRTLRVDEGEPRGRLAASAHGGVWHYTVDDDDGATLGVVADLDRDGKLDLRAEAGSLVEGPMSIVARGLIDPMLPPRDVISPFSSGSRTWILDDDGRLASFIARDEIDDDDPFTLVIRRTATSTFTDGPTDDDFELVVERTTEGVPPPGRPITRVRGVGPRRAPVELVERFREPPHPEVARYEISSTADGIVVELRDLIDPGQILTRMVVLRDTRGYPFRFGAEVSFVQCRIVFADPLGIPFWLTADPANCRSAPEITLDEDGLAASFDYSAFPITFSVDDGCRARCTLVPASPLDDGSALAILAELFPEAGPFAHGRQHALWPLPRCEARP